MNNTNKCGQISHMRPCTALLNVQLQQATEAVGWLKTSQGQQYFMGYILSKDVTQATTNFSKHLEPTQKFEQFVSGN